jgi:small subunit ribosomal protein S20
MPNIKSAIKRDIKSKELRSKNRADRTQLKNVIKKFDKAVEDGNKEEAAENFKSAVKAVDKAAGKGLIHRNNAANKKSAMATKLNHME